MLTLIAFLVRVFAGTDTWADFTVHANTKDEAIALAIAQARKGFCAPQTQLYAKVLGSREEQVLGMVKTIELVLIKGQPVVHGDWSHYQTVPTAPHTPKGTGKRPADNGVAKPERTGAGSASSGKPSMYTNPTKAAKQARKAAQVKARKTARRH